MLFKVCCLQVCPQFLWSHDCPKSPLCTTDAKMSNDPIGFGRTTLDLLNQGRNRRTALFIPPLPGAVPQPWRASWAGGRCLGMSCVGQGGVLGILSQDAPSPPPWGLQTEHRAAPCRDTLALLCGAKLSRWTHNFLSTYTSSVSDMLAISF